MGPAALEGSDWIAGAAVRSDADPKALQLINGQASDQLASGTR